MNVYVFVCVCIVWMYTCIYTWEFVGTCMGDGSFDAWGYIFMGSMMLLSEITLYCSHTIFNEPRSLIQTWKSVLWIPCLFPSKPGITDMPSRPLALYLGSQNPVFGAHTCGSIALTSELSPQLSFCLFWNAGYLTQSLMHAQQALCHWATCPYLWHLFLII